jgi:hypothetical protein
MQEVAHHFHGAQCQKHVAFYNCVALLHLDFDHVSSHRCPDFAGVFQIGFWPNLFHNSYEGTRCQFQTGQIGAYISKLY